MKRDIGDLAVFGGRAAFLHPLYVGRPNRIDRARFFDRLSWALDNQWLTNGGPLAREFEDRLAELTGVRNCVATCNATTALQLLARALDLSGEVVIPSLTFIATPHSVCWLGLEPVFCDVNPVTGSMDVNSVEATITERTSAILGVHVWGQPCEVDRLEKLAADKGLVLFFDAAHALGCTSEGRLIGRFGNAEVFSFHATKVVNAFEGGAILTDDDELAHRLRALHNFGIGLHDGHSTGGTNGKFSEASAAMGLTSLDTFTDSMQHNQLNYELYRDELADIPGLRMLEFPRSDQHNYQYVIAMIDQDITGIARDLLLTVLRHERVEAKAYFSPGCHQQEPYRSRRPVRLAHTERLASQVVALPTGTTIFREDIRRVCNIIRLAVSRGSEVTARWRAEESASE